MSRRRDSYLGGSTIIYPYRSASDQEGDCPKRRAIVLDDEKREAAAKHARDSAELKLVARWQKVRDEIGRIEREARLAHYTIVRFDTDIVRLRLEDELRAVIAEASRNGFRLGWEKYLLTPSGDLQRIATLRNRLVERAS